MPFVSRRPESEVPATTTVTPSPYWPRSTREQRKTSESFLLSTKTETQYGTAPLSREKATRAMRAAENLAVRAREI